MLYPIAIILKTLVILRYISISNAFPVNFPYFKQKENKKRMQQGLVFLCIRLLKLPLPPRWTGGSLHAPA